MAEADSALSKQTRTLLLFGFGGLLLLLAVSGLNALSVLHEVQSRSEKVRQDYLDRDRSLEQIRSGLYVSGTYVRDFLLDPDESHADVHRQDYRNVRANTLALTRQYRGLLSGGERTAFDRFEREVESYFTYLNPVLEWNNAHRAASGYTFMRESLPPRRAAVLSYADQITRLNARQLERDSGQVDALFNRFRLILVTILAGALLLGSLLAGLSIYRVLHLERLSDRRLQQTEEARAALRNLSARLVSAQESERRAISRELHDEIGQQVSALLLAAGNVAATLSLDTMTESKQQLQEIRRVAEKTVASVRDMSLLLRPSMLDDLGLIPALEWQAREISRNHSLSVTINANRVPEDLADEERTCIYRVTQEALRNVVRHSNARSATVTLEEVGGNLRLTIHDDGQGFVPERQKGLGLLGLEERVLQLNGTLNLQSQPSEGTTLIVEMPIMKDDSMPGRA